MTEYDNKEIIYLSAFFQLLTILLVPQNSFGHIMRVISLIGECKQREGHLNDID